MTNAVENTARDGARAGAESRSTAVGALPNVDAGKIPSELRELPQWVAWRWENRGGKRTKPPVNPQTGGYASSTDPQTWGSFAKALAAGEAGVGFVFTMDDPYAGVDLDKCRDPKTGVVEPWARVIIDALSSYTEVSPSGTGVKIIVRATLPDGGRKAGNVEVYDRGRYFTITGWRLDGLPASIEGRHEELSTLYRGLGTPRRSAPPSPTPTGIGDDELIRRASTAANGDTFRRLWAGNWGGYPSQSEADLALCSHLTYWTGGDPSRVDRLFRRSGLFRAKWDERHHGDGKTYGEATVLAALGGQTPRLDGSGGDHGSSNGQGSAIAQDDPDVLETDLGNARRLLVRHGRDIRYCFRTSRFHVWDGRHWPSDDTGEVDRRAKETVRAIFGEAESATTGERSKHLGQHAIKSQAEPRISAMVSLVRSEPGVPVLPEQFDAGPLLLNVSNGTIDLSTREFREHRREDLLTKIAPVAYDPDASAPAWLMFLDRIMDGNEELTRFLQKAVGYSLTGEVSEQVLFFLYGTGANGKSTFIRIVLDVLGGYAKQAAPGLLTIKRGETHPTEVADLAGARFVASIEVDEGRRLDEALVKWITGGDRIKARFMRQDFFEFSPTHKLWLAANHKPAITGTDHAIWRRVRLIPFSVQIPDSEQDRHLVDRLRVELPGILNWALEGYRLWREEGLEPPNEVRVATDGYRAEQDTIAGFLDDCCDAGTERKATAADLYGAYKKWCDENGESPLSQKSFGNRLGERGFGKYRGTNGQRWWKGVGLVTHQTLDLDTSDG